MNGAITHTTHTYTGSPQTIDINPRHYITALEAIEESGATATTETVIDIAQWLAKGCPEQLSGFSWHWAGINWHYATDDNDGARLIVEWFLSWHEPEHMDDECDYEYEQEAAEEINDFITAGDSINYIPAVVCPSCSY